MARSDNFFAMGRALPYTLWVWLFVAQ